MTHAIEHVEGSELKVGDQIIPWYEARAQITALTPYTGPLQHLFPKGARIASLAWSTGSNAGMTISNDDTYQRVIMPAPAIAARS